MDTYVRNRATGRVGVVVRGPYRKHGQMWVDVVFPNDFGEPGRYSQRCAAGMLDWLE